MNDSSFLENSTGQLFLAALLGLTLVASTSAQNLKIESIRLTPEGHVSVRCDTTTNCYYLLLCGQSVINIERPVALALGVSGTAVITTTTVPSAADGFYRLKQVPINQPLDTDGDGIDDVFELRHRPFLDPLDRSDGLSDEDNDGLSNWAEYRLGSDIVGRGSVPAVAAGGYHNLLLKTNGSLWAWGANSIGQLGDDSQQDQTSPVAVAPSSRWSSIAAGDIHSVGIKQDGTAWGWGDNDYGQLGDVGNQYHPVLLRPDSDWLRVEGGSYHSLATKPDGTLWGSGDHGDFGIGWKLLATSTNGWGCLAAGGSYASACLPSACEECMSSVLSAALTKGGSLWAWGNNDFGQVGEGSTNSVRKPTQVGVGMNWKVVAVGESHSVAIRGDGTLWAWGRNTFGQLGDGSRVSRVLPTQVGSDSDWVTIAAGYRHSLAIKTDGSLWAWGCNDSGQLGDGTALNGELPIRIGNQTNWISVAGGAVHSVGIRNDGSVWTWGNNQLGQLGDGTTESKSVPIQIYSVYD